MTVGVVIPAVTFVLKSMEVMRARFYTNLYVLLHLLQINSNSDHANSDHNWKFKGRQQTLIKIQHV